MSFVCSGATTATLAGASEFNVSGTFTLVAEMTNSWTGSLLYLRGTGSHTITTAGHTIASEIRWYGTGDYTLQDDFTATGNFYCRYSDLDTNGKTVICNNFWDNNQAETNTVTLGASTINCINWAFNPTNFTLNADTSTIKVTGTGVFTGGSLTYNKVELNGTTHTISGGNTFAQLSFKRSGIQTITFTDGTTQTVTNMFRPNDTNVRTLVGTSTAGWNLTKQGGGRIDLDYLAISYSTATADKFYAGANSTDTVGNSGWVFRATPKIAIYAFGANAVLKGGIEFGAEPTSLVDRSGYGNDGTYANITDTQLTSGLWSWDFNGTSSVIDCGLGTGLNITGNWSIALWAWHNAAMGNKVIFAKDNVSGAGRSWNLDTQGNAPRIYVFSGAGNQNAQATTVISDNVPHLIVCTSDGTNLKIFVDDMVTAEASPAWSGGLYAAVATKTYIGRRHHATPIWYVGSAGLPRVFPYALSEAQRTKMRSIEKPLFEGLGSNIAIAPGSSAKMAIS